MISEREKTILDCLDRPGLCGGIAEAVKGLWYGFRQEELDPDKLTLYVERMGNRTLFKRMGYLCEVLELPDLGSSIGQWRARLSKGFSLLDPSLPGSGPYDTRWRLRVNIAEDELTRWRES